MRSVLLFVVLITQLCPTLCDPMDCSLPGSSVHGISQARILVWVAIPFSRGSYQPRDRTWVSVIGRWILYHWATKQDLWPWGKYISRFLFCFLDWCVMDPLCPSLFTQICCHSLFSKEIIAVWCFVLHVKKCLTVKFIKTPVFRCWKPQSLFSQRKIGLPLILV